MLGKNIKRGVKCIVTGNNSRHDKEIGTVVTIESLYNDTGYITKEFGGTWFALNDLDLWEMSKNDIQEKLDSLTSKMEELTDKLFYLKSTNSKVLNVKKYKEYRISKIITSNLSPEEKAEMIMLVVEDKKVGLKLKVITKEPLKDIPESEEVEEMETEVSNLDY